MTTLATLARRRWAPFALAIIVALPSLPAGFMIDDWFQRMVLRGEHPRGGPLDLFTFADGDPAHMEPFIRNGPFPWFTLPSVKLRFFRPLSSLLVAADFHLFGDQAWLAHLHSIAWYLALIAVVGALYRRLLGNVAWLALLIFALDDSHAMPVDWLANRNALVASTFAWAGLWAHLRWREDGWAPGRVLSVLGFGVGLFAGEVTIAASAYLLAYELVGRRDAPRLRVLAMVPTLLALVGFVALYRSMNAGAYGSATYVDPSNDPDTFLIGAPTRFLALFGGWWFGPLQEVWMFAPPLRKVLIATGALSLLAAPFVWRWSTCDPQQRDPLSWLALGSIGALLPGLATFPSARLLTAPSLGLCALVAVMAHAAWSHRARFVGKAALAYLILNFAIQPLITWVTMPLGLRAMAELTREGTVDKPQPPLTGRVVILSAGDFMPCFYGVPVLAEAHRPMPKSWLPLSLAPHAHRVTRTASDRFELEVVGGAMLTTVFEQNVRNDAHPLPAGSRVDLEDLDIEVLADDEGKPTRLGVHLKRGEAEFQWVVWDGWQFQPSGLPAVGQTLELPRAPLAIEVLTKAW